MLALPSAFRLEHETERAVWQKSTGGPSAPAAGSGQEKEQARAAGPVGGTGVVSSVSISAPAISESEPVTWYYVYGYGLSEIFKNFPPRKEFAPVFVHPDPSVADAA